ncbi:MAG: hypothetical protein WAU88_11655 [Candidatus Zixiibacteriota bacterium]
MTTESENEQDLHSLLRCLCDLSDAMKGTHVDESEWLLHAEGLTLKAAYHGFSALYLARGTSMPELGLNFIDPASIQVVIRSLFEAVLTFNYVFRQPLSPEDRRLRYDVWRLSGMFYRHRKKPRFDFGKQKLAAERPFIDDLRRSISAHPFIASMPTRVAREVLSGKDWLIPAINHNGKYSRPTMIDVAVQAGLGRQQAFETYNQLSGYTHSTFASVFQLRQADSAESRSILYDPVLADASISIAVLIRDFAHLFLPAKELLDTSPQCSALVETWLYIGSDPQGEAESDAGEDSYRE